MRQSQKKLLYSLPSMRTISNFAQAFICMVLCAATPLHASTQEQAESMRKSVMALDSARQTALDDLGRTSLSQGETDDYKDFIIYLNTRIVNYCMELTELGGEAAVEGLPCPAAPMTGNAATGQKPAEETFIYLPVANPAETHTQAEKTASMDTQLFASLAEFDELLLKEEEQVSARVPSQREAGDDGRDGTDGSAGASGEAGESGADEQGGDGTTSTDTGASDSSAAQGRQTAQAGTSPSGAQSGAGAANADIAQSAYGAPGGKLPPPRDDDIVARQLREAAEKETDPELKKKLWEEYWKYKGVKKGE